MKKKLLWDAALLLLCLCLAGGFLLWNALERTEGAVAVVSVDGEEVARYPLDVPGEVVLHGTAGENILVIEDGCAYIREADCPDHVCVRTGKIRYEGETIVCLPHRLMIRIAGGEGGVDG